MTWVQWAEGETEQMWSVRHPVKDLEDIVRTLVFNMSKLGGYWGKGSWAKEGYNDWYLTGSHWLLGGEETKGLEAGAGRRQRDQSGVIRNNIPALCYEEEMVKSNLVLGIFWMKTRGIRLTAQIWVQEIWGIKDDSMVFRVGLNWKRKDCWGLGNILGIKSETFRDWVWTC